MIAKKRFKFILFKNIKKFLKQIIFDDFVDSILPEDLELCDTEKLFKFLVNKYRSTRINSMRMFKNIYF